MDLSVTQLKAGRGSIARLEREMAEHRLEDRQEFSAVRQEIAEGLDKTTDAVESVKETVDSMHGAMEVIRENQQTIMRAWGVRSADPVVDGEQTKPKKPIGLLGQREMLVGVLGAMGGLIFVDRIVVAIGPMTWEFIVHVAKAIAGIH